MADCFDIGAWLLVSVCMCACVSMSNGRRGVNVYLMDMQSSADSSFCGEIGCSIQ